VITVSTASGPDTPQDALVPERLTLRAVFRSDMNENEGAESPSGDGATDPGGSGTDVVVARVAEYDETLAEDVRRALAGDPGGEDAEGFEWDDGFEVPSEDGVDEGGDADAEAELAEAEERIAELEERLAERDEEIEDLEARLKRKQADFQNFKKRAEKKRERIQTRATEDLVERLLGVRDDLKRGIEEDHPDVESLRGGVEMVLRNFDRVLEDENVSELDPEPGEEVDPERHEVMMRVDSDQPEDTVAEVFSPGYVMGEKVIRAAKVTVSTGPADDEADGSDDGDA
jgi:molecular chaperone GrpE